MDQEKTSLDLKDRHHGNKREHNTNIGDFTRLFFIYSIQEKMVDKGTIQETGNVLQKLTSSERGTFLAIMIVALLSIVGIVIFYVNSMDGLIDKYNETINQQQKEFLMALKEFSK